MMSDCINKDDVNKQLACRLADPVADQASMQASQALLGLLETQAPNRVSISPLKQFDVGDNEDVSKEDLGSGTDIELAEQPSAESEPEEPEEESDEGRNVKGDSEEDDLPIGWMTARLQDIEEEHSKKVKALNREISILKKRNERLTEAVGAARGELKAFKKSNNVLTRENAKLSSSDSSSVDKLKVSGKEKDQQLKDAIKAKKNAENDNASLKRELSKKDKELVNLKVRVKEIDSELAGCKRLHKTEVDLLKNSNKDLTKAKEKLEKDNELLQKKVDRQLVLKLQHKHELEKIKLKRTKAIQKGRKESEEQRKVLKMVDIKSNLLSIKTKHDLSQQSKDRDQARKDRNERRKLEKAQQNVASAIINQPGIAQMSVTGNFSQPVHPYAHMPALPGVPPGEFPQKLQDAYRTMPPTHPSDVALHNENVPLYTPKRRMLDDKSLKSQDKKKRKSINVLKELDPNQLTLTQMYPRQAEDDYDDVDDEESETQSAFPMPESFRSYHRSPTVADHIASNNA